MVIIPLMLAWSTCAILLSCIPVTFLCAAAALVYLTAVIYWFKHSNNRWRTATAFFIIFFLILTWWHRIPASNTRQWAATVARLPWATISDDKITVYNIRNFNYTSTTNFIINYYTNTFDLRTLEGVDLIISYFSPLTSIAHTMLSFRFAGGDHLVLSVEVRRRRNDHSSVLLKGFFKQFEIIYVLGDERDLVRVRTNYRKENLYLYPTKVSHQEARDVLLDVLWQVNRLRNEPEFYNTLNRNCTVSLIQHFNNILPRKIPYTRILLFNGYIDRMLYERGAISTNAPFAAIRKDHLVTPIAQEYGHDAAFSRDIRSKLPEYSGNTSRQE
jgi:hypothetical protein